MDRGQFTRHRKYRALAGRVGKLRRRGTQQRDERGGVNDRPTAGPAQRRNAILATEKDALYVYGKGQIPNGLGRIHRVIIVGMRDTGVVEDHRQLAVFRLRLGHHPCAIGGLRNIGLHGMNARNRGHRIAMQIHRNDGGTLRQEQQRGLFSYPAAGPGDQGNLIFESVHVLKSSQSNDGVPSR